MTIRVAINGFGRIGRNILRAVAEADRKDIEIVAINDLAPVETNAHLLRFDSVHGRFPGVVKVDGDTISVRRASSGLFSASQVSSSGPSFPGRSSSTTARFATEPDSSMSIASRPSCAIMMRCSAFRRRA